MKIDDYEIDPNWYRSLGGNPFSVDFRSGHFHTRCDPNTNFCEIPHYDEHDPHESFPELIKHIWDDELGKKVLIGGGLVIADQLLTGGKLRKSIIKSLFG